MYNDIASFAGTVHQQLSNILDQLNAYEIPHSVKEAEQLLAQQLSIKEVFVNRFAEIDLSIDDLCNYLENGKGEDTVSVSSFPADKVSSNLKV